MIEIKLDEIYQEQENVFLSTDPPPGYKIGRSIVTTCYRQEIASTYILLNELSRLEFNLPIEVFYREGELIQEEIIELSRISSLITFKKIKGNAKDFIDQWKNKKGWSTKVYAILESEYSENLWIDNDNFPIRNCVDLFDDEEYKLKGSLFWRDVYSIDRADQYFSGSNMWKIFNVPYNDGEPFESGQIVLNKNKVWKELQMMKYFTDKCEIYYLFGGDAECWRMAWQLISIKRKGYHNNFNYQANTNVPYGFMNYGPFHKGVPNPWNKYGGGSVMVQRDRNGNELFNHRNIHKFSFFKENPVNADVINENIYQMTMRHLMIKYNPEGKINGQT